MTTVEILRKAKAEIERRGWCQGELVRFDAASNKQQVCAEGAINCARNGMPDDDNGTWPILHLFSRAIGGELTWSWNDAEGRTLPEVLDAFDRAIALASQPQGPGDGNG